MVRVKICGINDPAALEAAIDAGADWVGLNLFPPSPRALTPSAAAALSATHPGGPARVGLFVEPQDTEIAAVLDLMELDVLQIYADASRAAAVRQRFGRPVWRAIGVETKADLPHQAEAVDGYVIEAKPPKGAPLPAGNAQVFDWTLLQGWDAPLPWLLAGGLDPENVRDAIAVTRAPSVDVSSGVERRRGVKDPALIRAFIDAARNRG